MPRLQGLIFDLDGTLLDSAPVIRQAMNRLLAEESRRPLTLDEVKSIVGDGLTEALQRAFKMTGGALPHDFFPYVQKYIVNYRNTKADPDQIYPHVLSTLQNYTKAGVKLGVCTNKGEASTYQVLKELDIQKYFEFIAGGDTFTVHKPNPDHLLGVITGMDVPREGCVFIGDGRNDILAARGAKVPCIVVTHGYGDEDDTTGAAALMSGFDELPEALEKLGYRLG